MLLTIAAFSAVAVTIDFEDLSSGDILSTQYPGLIFSNAEIATAGVSVNEFEFPPRSGINVVFDSDGPISIIFVSPVLSFSGHFTYLTPLTIAAFDDSSNQVGQAVSLFGSNLACLAGPPCSGDAGSTPNEVLAVAFAGGISSVTIEGNGVGPSFTLDDAAFQAVPEPISVLLVSSAVGALIAFRRRNLLNQ